MGINWDFALQMSGEQACLNVYQPSHGNLIPEKRVSGLLLHAPLEGRDKRLTTAGLQRTGRSVENEVGRFNFTVVYDLNNAGIRDDRSERLHQVKSQSRSSVSRAVVKTHVGVQPG